MSENMMAQNDVYSESEIKYVNIIDLIRSHAEQKIEWGTMKEAIQQAHYSNLLFLKKADLQTKMSLDFCGETTTRSCVEELAMQMMFDTNVSPLIIAMDNHDDELVDLLLSQYGKDAILDDADVLSEAVYERYLDKILNYVDNNSEEMKPFLFSAFERVCQDMTKDKEWVAEEGKKIVSLFPNAEKYTDKEGRCFLSVAVENKQLPLCLDLLERGHSPVAYANQYYTETVFDIACYQKALRPKDIICQGIVDALRQKIPSQQLSYWREKEQYHEQTVAQSRKLNAVLIGGMVALVAAAAWFGVKVKGAIQQINEERIEKSIKKHDEPIDSHVFMMREGRVNQA